MAFWHDKITSLQIVLVQDPELSSQQKQEKAQSVPDPFSHEGVGSGDETMEQFFGHVTT